MDPGKVGLTADLGHHAHMYTEPGKVLAMPPNVCYSIRQHLQLPIRIFGTIGIAENDSFAKPMDDASSTMDSRPNKLAQW